MDSKVLDKHEALSEKLRAIKEERNSISSTKSLHIRPMQESKEISGESMNPSDTSFEKNRLSLIGDRFKQDIKKAKKNMDFSFKVKALCTYLIFSTIFLIFIINLVFTTDLGFVTFTSDDSSK